LSWHAAGGFHALNANPNMAILQAYTIDLLKKVEAESGQSLAMHMTGGIHVASAAERWEWLQASYRKFQAIGIDDVCLEIKACCPVINVDGVIGGMWADREGYVDTTGTVWAYAGAAKRRDGDRAQPGAGAEAAPGLLLGPDHRNRRDQRRAWSARQVYGRSRLDRWSGSTFRCRRSSIITF
jgi:glycine/D-amino acid oxidase-like deaminating enzyme